ncbi:lipase family protein [Algoriphagus sp. AK58]|uniref:lipase family protein n=1 Tax=Algoriphagus sp. AK58 TaxID=1406877 RepID=UPI00164F21D1|nr:lipase family protein [Algoriphagus sp. AK58]MBC6367792.1 lipase [Algoriphagus sp. AK58]
MIKRSLVSFCILFGSVIQALAQLQPGFSPEEYRDFLGMTAGSVKDTAFTRGIPQNPKFSLIYESPLVGLENKWYLWIEEGKKTAWFTIRGTANNPTSWLANFYAAMIPAKGSLKIRDDYQFNYQFAEYPKAAVHVGWTLSTGALAETLVPKIDSLYQAGFRDFMISGHSQGGAIAYLMTAHLHQLKKEGRWDDHIRIKTYASAAPKPGNLFFAYHYEFITQGGWAFNVVNASDWVPEVPFSIQTVNDFNMVNPFSDASEFIKEQKFPQKLVFKKVYNKLNKPTQKAQKNFEKFLGKYAGKQVLKTLPEYQSPSYFQSNHFTRTGNFIVLQPTDSYRKIFPDDKEKVFLHHGLRPYYFLLKEQFDLE